MTKATSVCGWSRGLGRGGAADEIDVHEEEEDVVILRQVRMFFWPWEDDEEFEEAGSSDHAG